MSERLADAVIAAGIDNIELFPARLRSTLTGATYDYRAFKLTGLIEAADLKHSEWSSYDGRTKADVSFESVAIDPTKNPGPGHVPTRRKRLVGARTAEATRSRERFARGSRRCPLVALGQPKRAAGVRQPLLPDAGLR